MTKKMGRTAFAAALAAAFLMAALPVRASQLSDEQNMDLSISKDATYTMTIPSTANTVAFGAVDTVIGDLSVSGDIGTKQTVSVTVDKKDFVDEKDPSNTIVFHLKGDAADFSGADWNRADALAAKAYAMTVNIPSGTWAGKAPGTYKASLIFHASLKDAADETTYDMP